MEYEYLNGDISGHGKEYNSDGKLIYEGEYLMNERDGEGKEYYENGNIKFEGEYSKGKKNGKIKEYDKNGKLLFEGKYINDYRVDDTIFSYGDKFESEEIYENRIFDIIIY